MNNPDKIDGKEVKTFAVTQIHRSQVTFLVEATGDQHARDIVDTLLDSGAIDGTEIEDKSTFDNDSDVNLHGEVVADKYNLEIGQVYESNLDSGVRSEIVSIVAFLDAKEDDEFKVEVLTQGTGERVWITSDEIGNLGRLVGGHTQTPDNVLPFEREIE